MFNRVIVVFYAGSLFDLYFDLFYFLRRYYYLTASDEFYSIVDAWIDLCDKANICVTIFKIDHVFQIRLSKNIHRRQYG
jgi:hypothetical protein